MMMGTWHYIFVQTHRMHKTRSEPSWKLWTLAIMLCQGMFISCVTSAPLLWGVDSEGSNACVGDWSTWELSEAPRFCCEPKTALEKLSLQKLEQ